MANTFELIASSTVGAGGASSIDFTSIPSTYTDLVLKLSARVSTGGANNDDTTLKFNNSSASFSGRFLAGTGSSTASSTWGTGWGGYANGSGSTASTFANSEMYIPNYAGSTNKSFSIDAVTENNATQSYTNLTAELWSNTTAINQITITAGSGVFVQYSTAYLYGVKNA